MDDKFHGYGRRIVNNGDYWLSQMNMGKPHGHHIQFNFDNNRSIGWDSSSEFAVGVRWGRILGLEYRRRTFLL